MSKDTTVDPAAAARAARLRQQIERLDNPASERSEEKSAPRKESPREFVHRRMHELDRKD
jgi:hypothetical protein